MQKPIEVDLQLQRKSSVHFFYSKKLRVCEQEAEKFWAFQTSTWENYHWPYVSGKLCNK